MATDAANRDRYAGESLVALKAPSERLARACPACDGTDARKLGVKNDLQLVSCVKCETQYTPYSPWYSSEEFYSGYYPTIATEPAFIRKRLADTISKFTPYRRTNRLLDLGCGTGALLQAAMENGWEAQGLDVSEPVVNHCRQLGLNVSLGELEKVEFPTGYFDVVTASELLEHLPSPRSLVAEVARILRAGGLFWTTTPHGRGASARLLGLKWSVISPPEHLQLFSISGARKMFAGAGFSSLSVRTEGTNPFELWHGMRLDRDEPCEMKFDRVQTSSRLNETLHKSPIRKAFKRAVNGVLNVSRLGDSLRIMAFR